MYGMLGMYVRVCTLNYLVYIRRYLLYLLKYLMYIGIYILYYVFTVFTCVYTVYMYLARYIAGYIARFSVMQYIE